MIGLSSLEYSLTGTVLLERADAKSRLWDRNRRVTRTATLDGSAILTDIGYSDTDRTLTIVEPKVSEAIVTLVAALQEDYATILVVTREGAFRGAIKTMGVQDGDLTITFLVIEKLSA